MESKAKGNNARRKSLHHFYVKLAPRRLIGD